LFAVKPDVEDLWPEFQLLAPKNIKISQEELNPSPDHMEVIFAAIALKIGKLFF
jgi:hypothetical protein